MNLSSKGLSLLALWEGFRSDAYLDIAGVPTIGYGTTIYPSGKKVQLGDKIDKDTALHHLKYDVESFEQVVNENITSILNQNQFDAAVIFCYNIGAQGFKSSSALKYMNKAPNGPSVGDSMKLWNKITVGGKKVVSQGLVHRRQNEVDLYYLNI